MRTINLAIFSVSLVAPFSANAGQSPDSDSEDSAISEVPEPAVATSATENEALKARVEQLELDLQKVKQGLGAMGLRPRTGSGGSAGGHSAWGDFNFSGYLNAPLKIGIGTRDPEDIAPGQNSRTFHSPIIPDDQFNSYQHTEHNPRNWSELNFSYGNGIASANLAFQAYNFSDSAWNDQQAQLGIAKAYVLLTPRLKGTNMRLRAKIGAFDEAYGAAGSYTSDTEALAGEFGTYYFGRTRGIGEVIRLDIPIKTLLIRLEHGFAGNRPDPSIYNSSRFTLLNHAHIMLRYRNTIEVSGHYLSAFAREEWREGDEETDEDYPDGSMRVLGGDLRLRLNRGGYYYAAYSYVRADKAKVVGPAIEVIHATGGGQYTVGITGNYLDGPRSQSNGDGAVHTVMAQIEHSVRKAIDGDDYWGQKMDLGLKLYGVYNKIRSQDPDQDGLTRFKWGADLLFNALPWLQIGTRFDQVNPSLNKYIEQRFAILSPRVVFRSNWITHEKITIQYSRYFYHTRTCSGAAMFCVQPPSGPIQPDGFGTTTDNQTEGNRAAPTRIPDQNVLTIQASMWW